MNVQENSETAPVMLFDGECGFCRDWIKRWRKLTGDRVRYAPYQELAGRYPQVTAKQCEEAVQLIMPDGALFSGAHAVFKALSLGGGRGRLLKLYESLPLFAPVSEFFYQLVAHHRIFFSRFS